MAGRRKVAVDDAAAWVFNRMADVYDARPAYPSELVDLLEQLAGPDARVADLGAGIGHLALPLAARRLEVIAVEPAKEMLERLRRAAMRQGLSIAAHHAAAEALPIESASVDLVIIADAVHFLDAALTGAEVRRVLRPGGALAIVKCELAATPFMNSLVQLMESSAPRRPRATERLIQQLASVASTPLVEERLFEQSLPLGHDELERVLRSISFIGPAMNEQLFETFRTRLRALPHSPVWARTFSVRFGRRRKR